MSTPRIGRGGGGGSAIPPRGGTSSRQPDVDGRLAQVERLAGMRRGLLSQTPPPHNPSSAPRGVRSTALSNLCGKVMMPLAPQ